jgi:hypothetical protein
MAFTRVSGGEAAGESVTVEQRIWSLGHLLIWSLPATR